MPARHISSQSFDEILSDLGDDPAIPDPHGIRKPPPPQNTSPRSTNHGIGTPLNGVLSHVQIKKLLQGFTLPLFLFGALIAVGVAFFIAYNALSSHSQDVMAESQIQISDLKKEIALIRDEIYEDQEDLYSVIDEMEVSIHSLSHKKPEIRVFNKQQAPNHESELRRWRYLGSSQMGVSHQAYFQTGKGQLVFEKGVMVLGDWRLSNIDKELVTLTNLQGKSLILKAFKTE